MTMVEQERTVNPRLLIESESPTDEEEKPAVIRVAGPWSASRWRKTYQHLLVVVDAVILSLTVGGVILLRSVAANTIEAIT